MAKATPKVRLAASGEELGEQLLRSVREMKAGMRGRVHTPELSSVAEARLTSGLSTSIVYFSAKGVCSYPAGLGARAAGAIGRSEDPHQGRQTPS